MAEPRLEAGPVGVRSRRAGRRGCQRHPDQSDFEEVHACALLDESSESSGWVGSGELGRPGDQLRQDEADSLPGNAVWQLTVNTAKLFIPFD